MGIQCQFIFFFRHNFFTFEGFLWTSEGATYSIIWKDGGNIQTKYLREHIFKGVLTNFAYIYSHRSLDCRVPGTVCVHHMQARGTRVQRHTRVWQLMTQIFGQPCSCHYCQKNLQPGLRLTVYFWQIQFCFQLILATYKTIWLRWDVPSDEEGCSARLEGLFHLIRRVVLSDWKGSMT